MCVCGWVWVWAWVGVCVRVCVCVRACSVNAAPKMPKGPWRGGGTSGAYLTGFHAPRRPPTLTVGGLVRAHGVGSL